MIATLTGRPLQLTDDPRCLWEHFISLGKALVQLKVEEVCCLSNFRKWRCAESCVGLKYAVQQDSVHFQGEQQCFCVLNTEVFPSAHLSLIMTKALTRTRDLLLRISVVNISERGERGTN